MAQQLPEAYRFDPADPRAPSEEQWERMSPEERARVVKMLPAKIPTELLPSMADSLLTRAERAEKRALAEAARAVAEPERVAAEAKRVKELQRQLVEGLKKAIEAVCEVLGIELSAARRSHLDALDAAGLDALMTRIVAERRWP